MKKARSDLAGRIYDIEAGRKGHYVTQDDRIKKSNVHSQLRKNLEEDEINTALSILRIFDPFYLKPDEQYKRLRKMWENYNQLPDKGKEIVKFAPEDASSYLLSLYKKRIKVSKEKYDFVLGVAEKFSKN